MEKGVFQEGSFLEEIFENYQTGFYNLSDHSLRITDNDFEDEILNQYYRSLYRTNLHYMVGASFSEGVITAWFNNQGYHTAPLTINLINNAILK